MANTSKKATARKPKKNAKSPPLDITRRQLAEALTVHMQTITKWERDGMPIAVPGRAGKPTLYRLADVSEWRAKREAEAHRSGGHDVNQARAQREAAQARLADQTFRMRQRELLPVHEVEKLWSAEVAAVRAKLLALPAALADQIQRIAAVEGVAAVEEALDRAIRDVLTELSDPDRPMADVSADETSEP